jgi:hypothetical protein
MMENIYTYFKYYANYFKNEKYKNVEIYQEKISFSTAEANSSLAVTCSFSGM